MDLNIQPDTDLRDKIENCLNANTAEILRLFNQHNSNYLKTKEKIIRPNNVSYISKFDSIVIQLISVISPKFNLSNNDVINLKLCNNLRNYNNYIVRMDNIFVVDCTQSSNINNSEGDKLLSCHLQNDYQTTTSTIAILDDQIVLFNNDMELSVIASKQLQANTLKVISEFKAPILYKLKFSYNEHNTIENITVHIEDDIWLSYQVQNTLVRTFVSMDYREINEVQKIFPGYCWNLFISLKIILGKELDEKIGLTNVSDLTRIFIPHIWLSDIGINDYFKLIEARSPDDVQVFDTYLYQCHSTRILSNLFRLSHRYNSVFLYKKLLFPINLKESHWIFYFINLETKEIILFDSFNIQTHPEYELSIILQYLDIQCLLWNGIRLDIKEYTFRCGQSPIQSQNNTTDCGVFVCATAEALTRDAPLDYTENDILLLRQRIAYELIIGKLLF
ncbi:Ulp1 protease family, C-terminal catalytic domain [Cinara cedri]|uniref:Ulp1 protease family, C-terminal catalytic domain n=1 Tax=Cinara cedri TaxID=506608 RepID=A0A5E4NJQ4_9HEMI|nr:Ulp1 protease family, C-terminal catalytic domain [Cinara cedri]